ncbi:MAG: restriction endonuclease subunit S [Elusimicrobia bacterium]|nr:restriction endonuclease subunit S [Elusimicrobiota bacterium]
MGNQINSLKMGQKFKKTPAGEIPVDWGVSTVGDLCQVNPEVLGESTPPDTRLKYIDISSIERTGNISAVKDIEFKDAPSRAKRIVKAGDIIVSSVRPYLRAFARIIDLSKNLIASTGFTVLRPRSNVDGGYIYQHILSSSFVKYLEGRMVGSNYPAVNASDVAEYQMPVPTIVEQKKIGRILSDIDGLIDATQIEIEKTKELKRGLMRQLLTRGIGHKKFKKTAIGKIPADWEIRNLDELSTDIYRYPTYFNIKYVENGVPEVRGELIGANGQLEKDTSRYRYISLETAAKFPRTKLEEGDFVLSIRGTMGKVAIVTKELSGANMTANLIRISPNRKLVIPHWLLHVLLGESFQKKLAAASSSTTIMTITTPELKNIKFFCPPLKEQQKMVDVLAGLDTQFRTAVSICEKTEELKKGLMKMLLTGKVRV